MQEYDIIKQSLKTHTKRRIIMPSNIKKRITAALTAFICFFSMLSYNYPDKPTAAAEDNTVPVAAYETDKSYDYSNAESVDKMSFGKKALGTVTVSGNINATDTYKDKNDKVYTAYGASSGQLSFSYNYDGSLLDENGDHYLVDDTSKKFADKKLHAKIKKGILTIQKSKNGVEWEDAVNPIVNFFEDNKNGAENFYTTNGKDLAKGMFYRITVAYETKQNVDKKIDPKTYHTEVYEFFACTNSGEISLHDLNADVSSIESEDYSVDVLSKGETLLDGSTTTSGFSIDTLGAAYSITVNGEKAANGDEFTEDGKYTVKAKTKLGKETAKTVYVFKGGEDKGKSTYFNDFLVTEKRIYRSGYKVPVYARDSVIQIKEADDNIPALTGAITNNDTEDVITLDGDDREAKAYTLAPGTYTAELFSGKTLSGSVYRYTFNFVVLDEEAKPYVNKHNLDTREQLCDFKTEHFEVAYETTRGGSIYVCFDSYDEAFKYAYQIEKRYLEYKDDGIYYWQDKGNNNQKVMYPSDTKEEKLALTAALNENARKNIETAYFDPSSEYSYQTFDENKPFSEALEDRSIADSARVFPDEEEKQALLSRDTPIINGYKYEQIGDYDVKTVRAKCSADSKEYDIYPIKEADKQLGVSSVYTITETDKYNDKNIYNVIYLAENTTKASLNVDSSGKRTRVEISDNSHDDIKADGVRFDEIKNELDNMAIVKIESEAYGKLNVLTCPVGKLKGLTLYKAGEYKVTFVDRVGNSFEFNITISGNKVYDDIKNEDSKTYSEIYNELHVNHKIKED